MKKYDCIRKMLCGYDYIIRKIIGLCGGLKFIYLCILWGVYPTSGGRFIGKIVIRNTRKGKIRIGKNVVLQANFKLNPIGPASPCLLDVRPGGEIEIGAGTGMTSSIISSAKKISIGQHCKIGGGVKIFDHNFHAMDANERRISKGDSKPREVHVGDDVFIGTNAIILKGTYIGARSVVAAGSVVFGLNIPPDSLVRGNPAEIVVHK